VNRDLGEHWASGWDCASLRRLPAAVAHGVRVGVGVGVATCDFG